MSPNSPRSGRKIVAHGVSRGFLRLATKAPKWGERGFVPHSFSSLHVHAVFSTKERAAEIVEPIRKDLHAYLGGIVREMGSG